MPRSTPVAYCHYCTAPLTEYNREDDHFPISKRHGGEDTVPACRTCHDMKDRWSLKNWKGGVKATIKTLYEDAWPFLNRDTRILVARACCNMGDVFVLQQAKLKEEETEL